MKADKTFRENLFKEARRRKDAEYVAAVLKVRSGSESKVIENVFLNQFFVVQKRVTQLQFLLDEANNSQSDSDKTPRSGEISSASKKSKDESDSDEEDSKTKKKPVKRAQVKAKKKKQDDDSDSSSDDD